MATIVNEEAEKNAECALEQPQDLDAEQSVAMVCPPASKQPSKAGRKLRFTPEDDLIIIREVAAAKAHVAEYGKVRDRFQCAAHTANLNTRLNVKVNAKSIQDRYKKLQNAFDREDAENRNLSGVGEEMGEAEELLSQMKEAKEDTKGQKDAERQLKAESERRKEEAWHYLVTKALGVRENGIEASDHSDPSPPRKHQRRTSLVKDPRESVESFGACIKESYMPHIELERERLDFEQQKFAQVVEERQKDREELAKDRELQVKTDIEKFRLMMEMIAEVGFRTTHENSSKRISSALRSQEIAERS